MKTHIQNLLVLLCLCTTWTLSAQNYELLLSADIQTPSANAQAFVNSSAKQSELVNGRYYRILQFEKIPNKRALAEIEGLGIKLLSYIPHNAYVASIPNFVNKSALLELGLRSAMPLPSAIKLDADILNDAIPDHAFQKNFVQVTIQYFGDLKQSSVRRWLIQAGVQIVRGNGVNNFISALVPHAQLKDLADIPYVMHVGIVPEPAKPEDRNGRAMHRANAIDTDIMGGRKYDGSGVAVQVRDDGPVGPHIDFHGRQFDLAEAGGFDINHADGVAGIFAGCGNVDPTKRGMAAGADMYVTNYTADFLDTTLNLHLMQNVLVTNSSYSNGCNDGYTDIAVIVDQQMFQNPTYLHVFSAGNSNNNDCGYGAGDQWGNITGGHKIGKNVIATANLSVDAQLVGSSSRGPAHDGRIKPDISAHGADHVSTDPNNTYDEFGGTSAAAPGIAGVTAMLHSAYQQLNDGEVAEAGLLKATLLNTANDRGNVGPDFKFGWGQVNALRAARLLEDQRYFTGMATQDTENTHEINIPANVRQAKIMVYWPDNESFAGAQQALVNDLDATVTTTDAVVYMPWILDHTPDPVLLDTPATFGEDHLNNVEQIVIDNPDTETYTLNINGTTIPFSEAKYFVTIEYIYDEIEIIHPAGGEGFVPGEMIRIHWDAPADNDFFMVAYTLDDVNWTEIALATPEQRQMDWNVPTDITGNAKVRVTRAGNAPISDQSDAGFSIIDTTAFISFDTVCPTNMRISWEAVEGATEYDVFSLGDKFMDSIGTTSNLWFDVPITSPLIDNWVAVRAKADGIRGRRSNAQVWSGGLNNCILGVDVTIDEIVQPAPVGSALSCGDFESAVNLLVRNGGMQIETDVLVAYSINGNTPVIESIPSIDPQSSINYIFNTPIAPTTTNTIDFQAWVFTPNDEFIANDSISKSFELNFYTGDIMNTPATEDFEGISIWPPEDWTLVNDDEGITFDPQTTTGIDGSATVAAYVNNYAYNNQGQEDKLTSWAISLVDVENPTLFFDVAYVPFNDNFTDRLVVTISDCEGTINDVVYDKAHLELATAPASNNTWNPSGPGDWRTEIINLSAYMGNEIFVEFKNITGYGNSLFLDNINIASLVAPTASFSANTSAICQDGSVSFTNTTPQAAMIEWEFGEGASPQSATGNGPHFVTFAESGDISVSMNATNSLGQDTDIQIITVSPNPVPDFNYSIDGNTVTFENVSEYGDSYAWDFGNATTSDEENPVVTYTETNQYNVELTVENECGTQSYTTTIDFVLGANDFGNEIVQADVFPNPNNGSFLIDIRNTEASSIDFKLLDITGKVIQQASLIVSNQQVQHSVQARDLPSGIYLVRLQSDNGLKTIRMVVE